MKTKNEKEILTDLSPQKSLEQILQMEMEVTEMIASARADAEKKVLAAQQGTTSIREKVINEARQERERMIKVGIEEARQVAADKVADARKESLRFIKSGEQHEGQAVMDVMQWLLGDRKGNSA